MEELEMSGKTVEEAIDKAVRQLGVGRDDVEVVVLDRGRGGFLGVGAGLARVKVSLRDDLEDEDGEEGDDADLDIVDMAKETIEDLLRTMGVVAKVGLPQRSTFAIKPTNPNDARDEQSIISFNIEGEDAGLLIGRRGETLNSFQFMVNFIMSRKLDLDERPQIIIDVEGYRERRNETIRAMARRMAERAIQTGQSVVMEPMPARERRVVHMTLAGHPRVTTESVGEGEERQVTIIPKRQGGGYASGRPPGLAPRPDGPPPARPSPGIGGPPSGPPRYDRRPPRGLRPR